MLLEKADELYTLLHACFIVTAEGLQKLSTKFLLGHFGICPRQFCKRARLLPIGMKKEPGYQRVKAYCYICQDIYHPDPLYSASKSCDGAAFAWLAGTSLPNMLFKSFPNLYSELGKIDYIPKIYGFRIFGQHGSKYEYLYNEDGKCLNQKEIDKFLVKKKPKIPPKKIPSKPLFGE